MHFRQTISLLPLLAGVAAAQTPPGFEPEVKDHLDVLFGDKAASPPGTSFTKAETQKPPTIGTSDVVLNGTYIWLMIDIDIPANFADPSAPGPRGRFLHALVSGVRSSGAKAGSGDNVVNVLAAPDGADAGPVRYQAPAPPPETPAHPHRYVQLLVPTADGADITQADVGQTVGFDVVAFLDKMKLGAPVRANYFNVTG